MIGKTCCRRHPSNGICGWCDAKSDDDYDDDDVDDDVDENDA